MVRELEAASIEILPKEEVEAAWNEWCLEWPEPIGQDNAEFSLFMTWLLSIHHLELHKENLVNEDANEYFLSTLSEPFTFYEAMRVRPGHGFDARCVMTGVERYVNERQGSNDLEEGDMLFGRIAGIQETLIFDVVAQLKFPPEDKGILLDLRSWIRRKKRLKKDALPTVRHLIEHETEVRAVYRSLRERYLNPAPPVLTNTHGDPLSLERLIFEIEDPQEAFEALLPLAKPHTRKELLEDAKLDSQGRVTHIEIPWLETSRKRGLGKGSIVLGRIRIESKRMTIEVNSAERGERIRTLVSELCGTRTRYQMTVKEALDFGKSPHEHQELMHDPEIRAEIRAKMREIRKSHMDSWVKQKIPVLGNKTPTQAMKTPEGREAVEALLISFERSANTTDDPECERELIRGVREKLGLS